VILALGLGLGGASGRAFAQPAPAASRKARVALVRLESLGLEPELVARLEALFRAELERVEGATLPARKEVDKVVASDATLRACTGEPECLAALGKKLGVEAVVFGTVAALGDSYVVNLKLVDVAGSKEIRRVEEPLSGSPDQLIEAVRVAAYRLYAPDRLRGAVAVLADVAGADVFLDGKKVGRTPLSAPVANLTVGKHALRISKTGHTDFLSDIEVRFQKTTQVVVNLVRTKVATGPADPTRPGPARAAPVPWYSSTWAYVGFGAAAVLVGVIVGSALVDDDIVDCGRNPAACGL
jgi:hypothetical protein